MNQLKNISMKKTLFLLALIAAFATNLCVAQNTSRGVKIEKEECEEMALKAATNPRAAGSGTSSSEAIALNIAKLQARNELAAQIAAEISGVMSHRIEQYSQTAGAGSSFNVKDENYKGAITGHDNQSRTISGILERDSMVIVQKVSQILTNTVPICKNSYKQPDGAVKVFVCIEMDLQTQRKLFTELKEEGVFEIDITGDGTNDIDMSEKEFLIELAKAREDYNAKKAREQ